MRWLPLFCKNRFREIHATVPNAIGRESRHGNRNKNKTQKDKRDPGAGFVRLSARAGAILDCLERAGECLLNLSGTPMGSFRNNAEKNVSRLRSNLAYTPVKEVISQGLHEFLDEVQTGLNQVGEGISETFFAFPTQSQ